MLSSNQETAIEINGVWKKYRIGKPQSLTKSISRLFSKGIKKDFWALKDINFGIKKGEIVGIIGPNGSGKSTILKLLAGVSFPTKGQINVDGKVAALLELGTGFQPELSGRENIFLYGAILGMSKREIGEKFESIVLFAELRKFLDTPVKHYSSGMFIRLAFSVAVHLEWDILLLDEILAVGDARFQKRSLNKIKEISREAKKTIVLVSHNPYLIRSLCQKTILLESGNLKFFGSTQECIDKYFIDKKTKTGWKNHVNLTKAKRVETFDNSLVITDISLKTEDNTATLEGGKPFIIKLKFTVNRELRDVVFGISVNLMDSFRLIDCRSVEKKSPYKRLHNGKYEINCEIENNLMPGYYSIGVGARNSRKGLDYVPDAIVIQVKSKQILHKAAFLHDQSGIMLVSSKWSRPKLLRA